MSNQHTPGPWIVDRGPSHPHFEIRTTDDEKIAYLVDHRGTNSADARLIAAAPELLEALEMVLLDEQQSNMAIIISMDTLAAIKSAIAKAKGTP